MECTWKPFKMNLEYFLSFLKENVPNADGILAEEDKFTIIEKLPFSEDEIALINDYLTNITEEDELLKFDAIKQKALVDARHALQDLLGIPRT